MSEQEKKELIAANIMIDQLTKRLILLESFYKQKIEHEQELASLYNQKAIDYWRCCLKIRARLAKLTGEVWKAL